MLNIRAQLAGFLTIDKIKTNCQGQVVFEASGREMNLCPFIYTAIIKQDGTVQQNCRNFGESFSIV